MREAKDSPKKSASEKGNAPKYFQALPLLCSSGTTQRRRLAQHRHSRAQRCWKRLLRILRNLANTGFADGLANADDAAASAGAAGKNGDTMSIGTSNSEANSGSHVVARDEVKAARSILPQHFFSRTAQPSAGDFMRYGSVAPALQIAPRFCVVRLPWGQARRSESWNRPRARLREPPTAEESNSARARAIAAVTLLTASTCVAGTSRTPTPAFSLLR